MKCKKIAVIGAGNVGSCVAYSCLQQNIAAEILLVDSNADLCKGQVLDLQDAFTIAPSSHIIQSSYKDAAQADVIVICAGIKQAPGQKRTELLKTNSDIISCVVEKLMPIKQDAIIIMVTNPLDVLTLHAQRISKHPRSRIFGSGTYLDTQRMRGNVASRLGVASESVHAYVLGEHGDTEFVAWSSARIADTPMHSFVQLDQHTLDSIEQETRNKAYEIIALKGSTYFGIASCVAHLCRCIIEDKKEIVPISYYHEAYDICFSMPASLGANGIEQTHLVSLNSQEEMKLQKSIEAIQKNAQIV